MHRPRSLFANSPRGGLVGHLALFLFGVAALSGSVVGCGETQPEHNWTGKGGSDLLRFVDSDGRTGILHARLERGEPVVEYELPGFGGGAYLIGVWCHSGAVDPRVEQYGEFEVLYGAAVDEAVSVRYARSTGGHAFLRTRRLPGLPLRWFAVHLPAGAVRSLNQVEAIGRGGLELGSPHYNRGDGTFPAPDGAWERRSPKERGPRPPGLKCRRGGG